LIVGASFKIIGREIVFSLLEKDKRLKDYLIITLGVLMVNLFLYSCGSDIGTLPEKDPDAPVSY